MLEGNALPLVLQVSSIALDIKVEGLTFLYLNLDFMTHPIRFLSLLPFLKSFKFSKERMQKLRRGGILSFWLGYNFISNFKFQVDECIATLQQAKQLNLEAKTEYHLDSK